MSALPTLFWWALFLATLTTGLFFVARPSNHLKFVGNRDKAIRFTILATGVAFALPASSKAPNLFYGVIIFSLLYLLPSFIYTIYVGIYREIKYRRDGRSASNTKNLTDLKSREADEAFHRDIETTYKFVHRDQFRKTLICMPENGSLVRMMSTSIEEGAIKVMADLIVPIEMIISVNLSKNESKSIETTTMTKRKGTVVRAAVGEVVFGGVGAVVGAQSAGSQSTSIGREVLVYQSSELTLGLSDLANPVVRFAFNAHDEADRWAHRIRSALANHNRRLKGMTPSTQA